MYVAQDAVELSKEQVRDGLALRRAYLLRSQQINQERQAISTQLADEHLGLPDALTGRSLRYGLFAVWTFKPAC